MRVVPRNGSGLRPLVDGGFLCVFCGHGNEQGHDQVHNRSSDAARAWRHACPRESRERTGAVNPYSGDSDLSRDHGRPRNAGLRLPQDQRRLRSRDSSWKALRAATGWRGIRSSAPISIHAHTCGGVCSNPPEATLKATTRIRYSPRNQLANFRSAPVAGLPRFTGGAVGYLTYEAIRALSPGGVSPGPRPGIPGAFHIADRLSSSITSSGRSR